MDGAISGSSSKRFNRMAASKSSVPTDASIIKRATPGSHLHSESDTDAITARWRALLGATAVVMASVGAALMRPPHAMANGPTTMPHATHTITTSKAAKTSAASMRRTSATAAAAKTASAASAGAGLLDLNHMAYQTTKVVHN